MIGRRRFAFCFAVVLASGACTLAQDDPKADVNFVLSGMRHERNKIRCAVCRITGRFIASDPGQSEPTFDGPITILAAFDGPTKVRFDFSGPGWVNDPSAEKREDPKHPGRLLGGGVMKGVVKTHFFDDGRKASFWKEDTAPSISVQASFGMQRPRVEFFDVRALGLYHELARQRESDLLTLLERYATMPSIPKVDRSDPSVWFVSWSGPAPVPDGEFRFWIDARNGFTPVRFEILERPSNSPKAPWTVTQKSETQWEQRGEVWIPIKHFYAVSSLHAKGAWKSERKFEIKWENINESLDQSLFSYGAFGAPDYVGVFDNSSGQRIVVKPIGELPKANQTAQERRKN